MTGCGKWQITNIKLCTLGLGDVEHVSSEIVNSTLGLGVCMGVCNEKEEIKNSKLKNLGGELRDEEGIIQSDL